MNMKIRRSMLFVPGDSIKMISQAVMLPCDAIIFDLEDSIISSHKAMARENVINYLKNNDINEKEVIIRINSLSSWLGITDLHQILPINFDTVLIPKATAQVIKTADTIITAYEQANNLENRINIIALIETSHGILNINEIASITNRLNGLLLGAEDLTQELGIQRTANGQELTYARSALIYAAKAHNIDAIDSPFTNYHDSAALRKETLFVKSLGMNAKSAIHPSQIEVINEIFTPTLEEILEAKKVLHVYQQSIEKGKGATGMNGKMVDEPIAARAQVLLDKAKIMGVNIS